MAEATDDYLYSFRLLRDFADYIALNVSSPNTPGLRELQEPDALSQLLRAIRDENQIGAKPILVKIAPDLSSTELEAIISTCEESERGGNHRHEYDARPFIDSAGARSSRRPERRSPARKINGTGAQHFRKIQNPRDRFRRNLRCRIRP